jgi:ParB family transcriptional regulator, chromosome partitioning protein
MKNKGLGRGLDALLSNDDEGNRSSNEGLTMLPTTNLVPGQYQPRKTFNEQHLDELTESIKSQGIMQPILVRKLTNDKYEIIAGERRWQASKRAGIDSVPVLIRDIPDSSALAMALIENIQREDLNVIEEAQGIKRLINEFGMTHEAAADVLGKSRVAVSNILRLLSLSQHVQNAILEHKIEMGHARALLSLDPDHQAMLCQKIISQKLSVRDVEKIVANKKAINTDTNKKNSDEDITRLENDLSEKLGMKVNIQHKGKGNGTLKINYPNLEQLDIVIRKLK